MTDQDVQAEVPLLTKKRDDLIKELSRLQVIKAEAMRQYSQEIGKLKRQRNLLVERIRQLKKMEEDLNLHVEKTKRDLNDWVNDKLQITT